VAIYSCDSSGIVKRYINETGSAWIASVLDPAAGNRIFIATITGVEVVSATARRRISGSLSAADAATVLAQVRHDFASEYRTIELTSRVIAQAMSVAELHALRGYDAVQLATALQVNALCVALGLTLTLISADAELNAAALAEGIAIENPNAHP